jgi:hypothetical protein
MRPFSGAVGRPPRVWQMEWLSESTSGVCPEGGSSVFSETMVSCIGLHFVMTWKASVYESFTAVSAGNLVYCSSTVFAWSVPLSLKWRIDPTLIKITRRIIVLVTLAFAWLGFEIRPFRKKKAHGWTAVCLSFHLTVSIFCSLVKQNTVYGCVYVICCVFWWTASTVHAMRCNTPLQILFGW